MAYFAPRMVKGLCRSTKIIHNLRLVSPCSSRPRVKTFNMSRNTFNISHSGTSPCSLTVTQSLRPLHTGADSELVKYLRNEISGEEKDVEPEPNIEDFEMKTDGTHVKLSRTMGEENINISFDVNKSDNVEHDIDGSVEEAALVSYPEIAISIRKQTGITLLFNCICEGIEGEDAEGFSEEGNDYELISIINVQVSDSKHSDLSKVYEADCESMDEELYSMLLHTLMERGIGGSFINHLLNLTTNLHQRQHLQFLKSLHEFVNEE